MEATLLAALMGFGLLVTALPPAARDEWQGVDPSITFPGGSLPTIDPQWQPEDNQTCFYMTNDYDWRGYGVNLCSATGECGESPLAYVKLIAYADSAQSINFRMVSKGMSARPGQTLVKCATFSQISTALERSPALSCSLAMQT